MATPVAGFPGFPLETIQEVLKFLAGKDLKILRLVCTQLNIVIEPNLLSCLRINGSTLNPDLCQLEMLATGRTRATLHARKLTIYFEDVIWEQRFDKFNSTEDHVKKYLPSVLSSLHNLDCLWWWMGRQDPYWTRYTIVTTISHLPFLRYIHLFLSNRDARSPYLPLDRFTGLTKIFLHGMCKYYRFGVISKLAKAIARSPHITHLEIDSHGLNWDPVQYTPSLHDLLASVPPGMILRLKHLAMHEMFFRIDAFTLPHLRSLLSLDLSRLRSGHAMSHISAEDINRVTQTSSTVSDIFAALTLEKIHLLRIVVDDINDAILTYLESYSSILERLEILHIRCGSAEESDALAKRFYNFVLPKHTKTIQVLKVLPAFEGEWCYSPQVAAALSHCQRLASLTVVLPSAIPGKPSSSSGPSDGSYNFDHLVTSIAGLSLTLPCLQEVNLNWAGLELHRNEQSSWIHHERVKSAIASSVERFKLANSTSTLCLCWGYRTCPKSPGSSY